MSYVTLWNNKQFKNTMFWYRTDRLLNQTFYNNRWHLSGDFHIYILLCIKIIIKKKKLHVRLLSYVKRHFIQSYGFNEVAKILNFILITSVCIALRNGRELGGFMATWPWVMLKLIWVDPIDGHLQACEGSKPLFFPTSFSLSLQHAAQISRIIIWL